MSAMERYSTDGMPTADRLPFWNDVALSTIGPVVVEPLERTGFSASMSRIRLRDLELASPISQPAVVRQMAGASDPGFLNLQVQHSGRSWNMTGNRTAVLDPGDFVLYDPSQPLRLRFVEPTQTIVLRLPITRVDQRLPSLRNMVGVGMRGESGAGAMLSAFVRNAWMQLSREDDPDWADSLCDVIWPMLHLVYGGGRVADGSRRDERRRAVFAFIDANLTEPEISTRAIAEEAGVSVRYVQMIFADMGTTPSTYIRDRRLDVAAERLRRQGPAASITNVAFDLGFNDLSSFCRAFRRRFGVAPRDCRAGAPC